MPGEMARSNPRPSVRVTRGAGSGQHLASVLQEGRENANIDAGWDSSGESRLISDKFTFVTVVFEAEYDLLSLQARSMRLYCPLEIVQGILVIDNSRTPISLNRQDRIRREYGHLSHFVQFVRYKQLAKMPDGEVLRLLGIWRGWYTQQVAKLLVSRIVQGKKYVVLDAKTHLIRELSREFLESPDGRLRTIMCDYRAHPLRPHLETVLRYLSIDADLERFPTTEPPFSFYTEIVRTLITHLSSEQNRPFEDVFLEHGLTEFCLYMGFIVRSGLALDSLYEFDQPSCSTIWVHIADEQGCRDAVRSAIGAKAPFFGVHRLAIARFKAESIRIVAEFWSDCRLFPSADAAQSFLVAFRRKYLVYRLKSFVYHLLDLCRERGIVYAIKELWAKVGDGLKR